MNLPFVLIAQAALSAVVGCVFAASALPKLRHPRGFVLAVIEYRVLPPRLSWIAARAIPPLELLAALLLLTGTAVRAAAALLIALLCAFIAAIGANIGRGRSLDCHCFGEAHSRAIGWRVLLEDALLLGACVVIADLTMEWGGLAPWSVFRYVGLAQSGVVWPLLGLLALVACAAAVAPRRSRRGGGSRRWGDERCRRRCSWPRRTASPTDLGSQRFNMRRSHWPCGPTVRRPCRGVWWTPARCAGSSRRERSTGSRVGSKSGVTVEKGGGK